MHFYCTEDGRRFPTAFPIHVTRILSMMALAIDTIDGQGLSNKTRRDLLSKKIKVMLYLPFISQYKAFNQLYITNKT